MGVMGKHGVSTTTPENILLGAGTIHKNLTWDAETSAWKGDIMGATSGGNSVEIKGEIKDIELDGALVKVKGLTQKIGEAGSMESNLAQHNKESFIRSIIGKVQDSLLKGMTQITTKSLIEASDYLDNIAYVGTMSNGTECIIIMENALCTNGFEIEPKNKDKAVLKVTFECNADFDDAHDTLPIYIFVPNKAKEEA